MNHISFKYNLFGNSKKKLIFNLAKNSVEVYINNHGTARSRCSSSCRRPKSGESRSSFHQLHSCSQESTLLRNESVQKTIPGLRR